jgi:hypothetical protein
LVIYIPLLNEGTDCWRPIEAEHVGTDTYPFWVPSQKMRTGRLLQGIWFVASIDGSSTAPKDLPSSSQTQTYLRASPDTLSQ